MANRRMISNFIVNSDAFLEMPATSQLLYFHLCMRADDDGFCANPRMLMRMINSHDDDLKLLIVKRFVLEANDGVILVKHWWVHNTIRKDTYHPSPQLRHNSNLYLDENNAYTFEKTDKPYLAIRGNLIEKNSSVNGSLTQIKLNKTKLNKNNILEQQEINSACTHEELFDYSIPESISGWTAEKQNLAIYLKDLGDLSEEQKQFLDAYNKFKEETDHMIKILKTPWI